MPQALIWLKHAPRVGQRGKLEPVVGIEPTTYGLRNRCSTTELHWQKHYKKPINKGSKSLSAFFDSRHVETLLRHVICRNVSELFEGADTLRFEIPQASPVIPTIPTLDMPEWLSVGKSRRKSKPARLCAGSSARRLASSVLVPRHALAAGGSSGPRRSSAARGSCVVSCVLRRFRGSQQRNGGDRLFVLHRSLVDFRVGFRSTEPETKGKQMRQPYPPVIIRHCLMSLAFVALQVHGQLNPPPVIFDFMPTLGAASDGVAISGRNFGFAPDVRFNGISAAFSQDLDTLIFAVVPTNASSGFISVTTPSGTAITSSPFAVVGVGFQTATLASWDVSALTGGLNNYGISPLSPTTTAPDFTVVGLTRGYGVGESGTAAARGWGGTGFTSSSAALAIAAGKFVTFSISANPAYNVSFSSISRFDYRRSTTGPAYGVLQFQIGSGAFTDISNLGYPAINTVDSEGLIDLLGFSALQNVGAGSNVTFRIVNFGGTSSGGNWYVFDGGNSAPDFAVDGIVTPGSQKVAPTLSIQVISASLVLWWPSAFSRYELQENQNLNPTNWTTYGGAVIHNASTMSVTIPSTNGSSFFRLMHR